MGFEVMRIILDAMGSDRGAREFVKAAVAAVDELDVDIVLVGLKEELLPLLREEDPDGECSKKITIVNASEVVDMNDDPVRVMKEKPDSSMTVAMRLLTEGGGDALVSAGNTGALLTQATLIVKRIKGVRRAALAPVIPTTEGFALLIDSGANVECTPEVLLQFALMGAFYTEHALGVPSPRVGLLNNGAEEHKGDELHREAYKLLKKAGEDGLINFIGNIEGRDAPLGRADVIVADGFSGNVFLKTMEGVGLSFAKELKKIFMISKRAKLSAFMVRNGVREFKRKMDYNEAGGAPLLGVKAPVIKAHGSASSVSIGNCIGQAMDYVDSGMILKISNNFSRGEASRGE